MKILLKKRKKPVVLIAMSDIAFLLLIFLIIIVNVKSENEVILPTFNYSIKAYPEELFMLTVMSNGDIFTADNTVNKVNINQLQSLLVSKKDISSIGIYADKDTDYEHISNVLQIIQESEISNIILLTDREDIDR